VHFAGEATDGEYMGSVHAAFLSGLRAAAEIICAEGDSEAKTEDLEVGGDGITTSKTSVGTCGVDVESDAAPAVSIEPTAKL